MLLCGYISHIILFCLYIQVEEKYRIYKERLEQALALVQGNSPADDSVVEQKPPVDSSAVDRIPSDDEPVLEQKAPSEEPVTEEESLGGESVC